MSQAEKALRFSRLHIKGDPVVLYNAWDAGSARAIVDAGAAAVATSSWAVAEAQGYRDGEAIPLELLLQIVARITASVAVPVTVDFEGGYTENDAQLATNVSRLLELGVIGINFEDRVVQGSELYPIDRQARRISAIREAARKRNVDLFINARTDVFLGKSGNPAVAVGNALERARAYAAAGASGFFVPGLRENALIRQICAGTELPVNVMVVEGLPSTKRLSELGVARVSYGPIPYVSAVKALKEQAEKVQLPGPIPGGDSAIEG